MRIFRYDNNFWRFMSTLVDVIIVSIVGFIGCIPILTIGRSVNAMMHTFRDIDSDKNSSILKSFFKHYKMKRWFVWPTISVLLMAANLFATLFILFDENQRPNAVFLIALFMYLFLLIINIYIFPLMTFDHFEKYTLMKLIIYIAMKNISYTVLLTLINGILLLLLIYIIPYLSPIVMGLTLWLNYKIINDLVHLKEYDKLFKVL